jgi:hypothetical protein
LPNTVKYQVRELSIREALNEVLSESNDRCTIWWKVAEAGRRTVIVIVMKAVIFLPDIGNVIETVDK